MKKILIADVKSSITNLLIQFLSSRYIIETKEDGFETLTWLQMGNFPDLIITDLQLPTLDGVELIRRLKESGYFRNIPIIVLSGNDNSTVRVQCLKLGADDYIVKPFNPDDLIIRIENILLR